MNEREAIMKLHGEIVTLTNRSIDQLHIQDALVAMVCALVETHPDKTQLHASFSKIWQNLGGPKRAIAGMGQGQDGAIAAMAAFSQAIGRELP